MKKIFNEIVLLSLTFVILCGAGWLMNPYRLADDDFSPSDISNLIAWYDASVGITLNGSDISQWDDQSGNANHVAQSTAANQPFFNSSNSNFNNQATVDFDGAQEHLFRSTFVGGAIAQPNTVFVVGKRNDADTGFQMMVDGVVSTARHVIYSNNSLWTFFAGNSLTGSAVDTNTHIFLGDFNTTNAHLYVDGGISDSLGDVGSNSMNGIALGIDEAFLASTALNGTIAEAGVYTRALTTTEQNNLGNSLADKYGTTWTDIT